MSELFDLPSLSPEPPDDHPISQPMTSDQRDQIRTMFAALDIRSAREQFELVQVLIGIRLQSVKELTSKDASALVPRLRNRVESRSKTSTGNSWDDREEDTWIDNL